MSASSTPDAHPLAQRLIERYRTAGRREPVLEIGAGRGRNTRAFVAAGIPLTSTRDDEPYTQLPGGRDAYAAAFSSHAYLHGSTAKLRAGMGELRRVLRPGAPAFFTLGSIADPRFGFGEALDERTFAPGDGDEIGIPHAYFEPDGIRELLRGLFTIETLEEVDATAIVGRWAHPSLDAAAADASAAQRIVHYFVVATKR
jgi:SAM-dependent methyltransferase